MILPFTVRLAEPAEPGKGPVKLAVLLVFDQLRSDYLIRWHDLFEKDGFRRLLDEGAWFQDCYYPFSDCKTGPGHASLATGCSPCVHGIVSNDWFDREAQPSKTVGTGSKKGAMVYCATLPAYKVMTVPPREPSKRSSRGVQGLLNGCWPRPWPMPCGRRRVRRLRIVSLSLKDRSAVLPGGKAPDACYWFDSDRGQFVTSSYYPFKFHSWVAEMNRSRWADRWFGTTWDRLLPALDYELHSGPDDVPGEGTGIKQGRTFPHPLDGGLKKPGKEYYDALANSPAGNELLLDLTRKAIVGERLGRGDRADLLCVSFSSNDLIGHTWGPDSQEVQDVTLRTDRLLRDLLHFLDDRVGKGRYLVVLSADHGVAPLPEVARQKGHAYARRINPESLLKKADEYLIEKFGGSRASGEAPLQPEPKEDFYFNPIWLRSVGKTEEEAAPVLADWLKSQPGIQTAYTRAQLLASIPEEDAIGRQVQRSFHPRRSGDVMPVLAPYCFMSTFTTGTTHGAPHSYDTHVPLVVFGPNVKVQVRRDRVTPQSAAAILAHGLGVNPPAKAEAGVPEGLFER